VPVVAAASQAVVMVEESGLTGNGFLIDRKGHVVTDRRWLLLASVWLFLIRIQIQG
jgi:hypothetical protein